MDSIRTVVFMADQRGVGEDLYRCKETGKVYIRQECDEEYVRWLTSNKWIAATRPVALCGRAWSSIS